MGTLPALITSGDLLPGGGALNGRRWAGQQLLKSWAARSGPRPMALASPRPQALHQLLPFLRDQGFEGELNGLDLLFPQGVIPWGGLFLPDPSIGRWALWRQPVGASTFSLIGQIHTLSTPAALAHLQDLVSEPVQPWDALICSSTAGRSVVEVVLNSREEALAERSGGHAARLKASRPQLPVIPLPLPESAMSVAALDKLRGEEGSGSFRNSVRSALAGTPLGVHQARSMADLRNPGACGQEAKSTTCTA